MVEIMCTYAERLQAVRGAIHQIMDGLGHADARQVALIAVSKAQTAEAIRQVFAAGQSAFGENYLQEALDKQLQLADLPITWHFIGPIQSNKTSLIAQHFDWVHSVDRLKIAQRLQDSRPDTLPPLNVCVQINVSGEASKSGLAPEDAEALIAACLNMPKLRIRGLMTIPAPTSDSALQRAQFASLAKLQRSIQQALPMVALDTLSMGMSDDYPSALQEGATMLRIGTAIFGARAKSAYLQNRQDDNPANPSNLQEASQQQQELKTMEQFR